MEDKLKKQAIKNVILEIRSGSHLYGTNTPESDEDFVGIFMPPEEYVFGLKSEKEIDLSVKDKNKEGKNTKDAVDRKLYEFRKFVNLAQDNNPNILELLFVNDKNIVFENEFGALLRKNKNLFPSKLAAKKFLGYAYSQRHKMVIKRDHFNDLQEGYRRLKLFDDKITMETVFKEQTLMPWSKGSSNFQELEPVFTKKAKGFHIQCGDLNIEPGVYVKKARKIFKERLDKITNRSELILKYGYDCYSEDTEFLTKQGWKTYSNISNKEKIATLNPGTHSLEFQKPYERVCKPYSGKLFKLNGKYTSALVTRNHRMYISDCHRSKKNNFNTTYDQEQSNWRLCALQDLIDNNRSNYHVISVPKNTNTEYSISNSELQLIAAFVSEGTINFYKNKTVKTAIISQTDHGKLKFISIMQNIILDYNGTKLYVYDREDKDLKEFRWHLPKEISTKLYKQCGHLSSQKHLPNWKTKLSKNQAQLMLDMLCLGDGTEYQHSYIYYTQSKKLADDVQVLALLAEKQSSCNAYSFLDKPTIYQVRIVKKSKFVSPIVINPNLQKFRRKNHLEEDNRGGSFVSYKGNIVCFSVPNEILITRHKGKIAIHGNTKFGSHLIRLMHEGIDILQQGYLEFPLPQANMILDIKKGKWTINEVINYADELEKQIGEIVKLSKLPATPKYKEIEELTVKIMKAHLS